MNKLTHFISALFFVILNVSQAWALPNCVGSYSTSKWNNCFGTYNWDSGNEYVGEHKNGMAHGQGTFTFADGSKWVEEWENGDLNGYAITYKADGSINQEGIFKNDVFQYAQKKSKLDEHKDTCKEIGFIPKTEKFSDCVLKLMDKD